MKDVGTYLKENFAESIKLLWPVILLYVMMVVVVKIFLKLVNKEDDQALFWISITRFIMLGVFFVVPWIGAGGEKVLPLFLWAFVVQILINLLISHIEHK